MTRSTQHILVSAGGLAVAGLLFVIGVATTRNADLARGYVRDQLSRQEITFKALDALSDEEKRSACLVTYAGQRLTTGHQAGCYAGSAVERDTAEGEALHALLVTSYGFSVFGGRGRQVATASYLVAVLLALLSAAGFARGFITRKPKALAAAERRPRQAAGTPLVEEAVG